MSLDRHMRILRVHKLSRKTQRVEAIFMADARVERRLAAILAADVAGFTRLMGDERKGRSRR